MKRCHWITVSFISVTEMANCQVRKAIWLNSWLCCTWLNNISNWLFCLHPKQNSVSSRSLQHIQRVQFVVPKQVLFFSVTYTLEIWMREQSMLHRSRNSGRDFLVEPAPLWASSYTHLLYKAQDPFSAWIPPVQLFLNKFWNVWPVYPPQIKSFRKRFLVETAPLWASSYTHLLYKAQVPFNVWTQ